MIEIPKWECPDIWTRLVDHDTNGQNHGPVWKTQSSLTVILWQDYCGKGNLRNSY